MRFPPPVTPVSDRMTIRMLSIFRLSLISLSALALAYAPLAAHAAAPTVQTVAGMPPVINPVDLYSEAGAGRLSAATAGALSRIYVPNLKSSDVYVIDPATFQ